MQYASSPKSVEWMLGRAEGRGTPELLTVADAWIAKWSALADEQAATGKLDGRASIYTGETYAQARDRWLSFRAALVASRGVSNV